MKQTQEFDGKTVDDAVEKACSTLSVSKKNLVYDVISTGSSGIFGIVGVKKARIRVTLPEKNIEKTSEDIVEEDSDFAGVMSIVDEAFGDVNKAKAQKKQDKKRGKGKDSGFSGKGTRSETPGKSKSGSKGAPSRKKSPEYKSDKHEATDKPAESDAEGQESKFDSDPLSGSRSSRNRAKTYHKKSRFKKKSVPGNRDTKNGHRSQGDRSDASASTLHTRDHSDDSSAAVSEKPGDEAAACAHAHVDAAADSAGVSGEESATHSADASRHDNGFKASQSTYTEDDYFPEGEDGHTDADGTQDTPDADEGGGDIFDDRDEGYPPKYKGEIPVDVSEEAVQVGREALQRMVSLITEDAVVVAETDEDRLLLRVEGGNSGVLIGRRGQTLEAMQFLTDKIINRHSESRVRLKVDIEGYMETRKANLQSLAYKMADKAKKTGKPATINQMTAQDRRIVHLALKDDHRVRTQSMGDGYYRRLVIFPKKGSWKRRRNYRK